MKYNPERLIALRIIQRTKEELTKVAAYKGYMYTFTDIKWDWGNIWYDDSGRSYVYNDGVRKKVNRFLKPHNLKMCIWVDENKDKYLALTSISNRKKKVVPRLVTTVKRTKVVTPVFIIGQY